MKLKLGFVALGLALIVGMAGCAHEDGDYAPAKRPGFRPPSTPLVQDDLPPVDPLGTPPANESQEAPPSPAPGFQAPQPQVGSSAVVSAPPPQPRQAPTPAPEPAPAPPPQPSAPPPPKSASPEYAKRVPGKPNWIRSPYDGKILDATGFPPGTEVRDPQSGKIMLVP